MLTDATKKKINTARDILVGVVPVPTSQVEQITLAMIYKFMSDLDKKARDLGDTSGFFANGYEKYSWDKLMDKSLGARERVKLYSEGLEKMSLNPHIPQLFRDIFKNAFLRFNNPETLKMFLDTIDQFEYDHSEELGNAFEYLLQVMGSQGDAGQFRTPRHIIDFIVEVVEPKKTDKILDPACGTAGFLIAAYKYLKSQGLQSDELKELSENFVGYDISSDMQRLSLVNMYLHNFPDPHIYEYDSLTSEERWDDDFDVILANPPFMSPKGGIKPHSRFSVPSKRAEVLFVDYIMEHLTTRGKAGVIVPEGIIFQSQNAYKDLRKMMVDDDFLWAVVSLPSGVFQPYAGVKTSILLFDREIAKKTNKILFVKVENDGYDLGAQRRTIKENDLPVAKALLKAYKNSVLEGKELDEDTVLELGGSTSDKKLMQSYGHNLSADDHIELSQIINKAYNIASKSETKRSEYNLSGERYKDQKIHNSTYDLVALEDVLDYEQPTKYLVDSTDYSDSYETPVLTAGKSFLLGYTDEKEGIYKPDSQVILFDDFTTATKLVDFPFKVKSSALKILTANQEKADIRYIYYVMQGLDFDSSRHKRYWISQYSKLKIPHPPLSVQQEIVGELDRYQKIIDGARQVVDNYQPSFVIEDDWEWEKLGQNIDFVSGVTISITQNESSDGVPLISIADVTEDGIILYGQVRRVDLSSKKHHLLKKGDLLFNWRNGSTDLVGKTAIFEHDIEHAFASFLLGIRAKEKYLPKFLWYLLNQFRREGRYIAFMRESVNGLFNREELKILEAPVPSIDQQREIIDVLDQEMRHVDSSKNLISLFEQRIEKRVQKIWNE